MKRRFETTAWVALAAALVAAPAVAEEAKSPFTWGADLRLRQVFIGNVGLDDEAATADRTFQRYRARVWGQLVPTDGVEVNARLMWEGRHYNKPDEDVWPVPGFETWYSGAVLFDNLNLNLKRIGGTGLSLKLGRQDIIFGNGWLVLDGTPLDGSRTIYFDAARATFAADQIGTTFDVIYLDNDATTDRFPQQLNDDVEDQIEQNEKGVILYARNKSLVKDWDLDAFLIHKENTPQLYPDRVRSTLRVNNGAPFTSASDDGDVYALGVRVDGKLTPNWALRAEAAAEWGDRNGADVEAFGVNGRVTYLLNDGLANRLHLGYEFLSGDDPDSEDNEAFDPLWGRWPQWSELLIYQWPMESRVGEATNFHRLNLGWGMKPHPTTEVTLDYHALWADENTYRSRLDPAGNPVFSDDGSFRGHLFTGWVKSKFNKYVSAHLVGEYFNPGDYYSSYRQDDSFFVRAELNLTW